MRDGEALILSDYAGAGGAATGGAGVAVMDSFLALRSSSCRVKLLAGLDLPGRAAQEPGARSLGGEDLRAGSTLAALRVVHNPASRRALADRLRDYDPARTVVILHQWTRYLTPSAIALLRPFPLMIYMHDYFWMCPNGAYFDFREAKPCTRLPGRPACIAARCDREGYGHKLVRLARHAALTVATRGATFDPVYLHISRAARRVAEPLLPQGRHVVIYNPLTLAGAITGTRPERRFDVGYFGRLEPEKGIAQLAAELARQSLRGLFVGEGSLAENIERVPGMTRLPWQPKRAVSELMRQCGAVALPSLWPETWGLIIPEAMAAGVPVIVSAHAGSSELVERFGGGASYEPDDPGQLAEVLAQLKSGAPLEPLTATGRAGLRNLLSPERHAAEIASIARETWQIDIGACPQPPAALN